MAKIEITLSADEKARLQHEADKSALKLATWAKAQLLLLAMGARENLEKGKP